MKEQAARNLATFADLLDALNIVFWIDGGTLLGAYRDQDFCEGDEGDCDLFTWSNYQYLIPQIKEKACEAGFTVDNHWTGDARTPGKAQEIAFKKDGLKIDLNFFEKKEDMAWGCAYQDNKCLPQVTPARFYEELGTIEFYGRTYNCPRDIEGHLTYRYGDWKTPIPHHEYSCFNPEHLHSIKLDFKFYE